MTLVIDDLMSPEVISDPHSYYRGLRENDPVHWNEMWGGWVLTRYDDAVNVLRDNDRFSSDRMAFLKTELNEEDIPKYKPIFDVMSKWMVFIDPPDHTRLRRLLNTRFTPRAVDQYRPRVRSIVRNLLKEIKPKGSMDVIRDFAYLVPLTVILELLGAPGLDRDLIKEWSEKLGVFFFIRADEPKRREICCEGINSLVEYLKPLIEQKRKAPSFDLISALVAAEEAGELSEQEVIATCVLLVFGGHETTMNQIANGILAFIKHPDQWEKLKSDPSLNEKAVEELLRYDGTVKATVRWARENVEVGGRTIKANDRLLVALSAANRDPEQFENPDELIIDRWPNPHVAFAHGIHVCLGAPLARMEVQEAFAGLVDHLPVPRLTVPQVEYLPTVVSRAPKAVPIEW